jgi:phospholipid transport system substrate-binding protein
MGMLAVIAALAFSGTVTAGAASGGPGDFIRIVGQEAIDTLTQKELSEAERQDRFREILNRTFEIKVIARFALGRYWRRASEAQRTEYIDLFEDFIVQAYSARFRNYSGDKFTVGQVRELNTRDRLVQSEILLKDGRKIPVFWRVRKGDPMKIVDVMVEGVSMAITQRDEFSAIINQNGGKIDGLIAQLRKITGRN